MQGLAWLPGWSSLLAVVWLVQNEGRAARAEAGTALGGDAPPQPAQPEVSVLQTRWCASIAVTTVVLTAIAHLYSGDWIFDRPVNQLLLWPALSVLGASVFLLRAYRGAAGSNRLTLDVWNWVLLCAPALAVQWAWEQRPGAPANCGAFLLSPAGQFYAASCVFYVALSLATRRPALLTGLLGPLAAPVWRELWKARATVPHLRALATVVAGFLMLAAATLVSVFRERLLRRLAHSPDPADTGAGKQRQD